jgi:hypothetical protein
MSRSIGGIVPSAMRMACKSGPLPETLPNTDALAALDHGQAWLKKDWEREESQVAKRSRSYSLRIQISSMHAGEEGPAPCVLVTAHQDAPPKREEKVARQSSRGEMPTPLKVGEGRSYLEGDASLHGPLARVVDEPRDIADVEIERAAGL